MEHATGKVRPKPWMRGGGGGGGRRPPSPRPMRRSYDIDRERCAYCGERGHPSYDCPRERRGRRRCVACPDLFTVAENCTYECITKLQLHDYYIYYVCKK